MHVTRPCLQWPGKRSRPISAVALVVRSARRLDVAARAPTAAARGCVMACMVGNVSKLARRAHSSNSTRAAVVDQGGLRIPTARLAHLASKRVQDPFPASSFCGRTPAIRDAEQEVGNTAMGRDPAARAWGMVPTVSARCRPRGVYFGKYLRATVADCNTERNVRNALWPRRHRSSLARLLGTTGVGVETASHLRALDVVYVAAAREQHARPRPWPRDPRDPRAGSRPRSIPPENTPDTPAVSGGRRVVRRARAARHASARVVPNGHPAGPRLSASAQPRRAARRPPASMRTTAL